MTPDQRAWAIVLHHAHQARVDTPRAPNTLPIDQRCASCGVDRDGCDRPYCLKHLAEGES